MNNNEMACKKSILFFVVSVVLLLLFSFSVNANPCGNNKIALLGDSITNYQGTGGWGNEFKKLCDNIPVNFAHSGKKTDWMLQRLKGEVDDSSPYTSGKILDSGYDHLIVLGGTNDVTVGWSTSKTKSNLEQIYFTAKQKGMTVIAGTITPYNVANSPERNEKVKDINEWIRSQYQLGNIDGVIDFYQFLVDQEPCINSNYVSSCNNVHLNTAGYKAMANKAITDLFGGQAVTGQATSVSLSSSASIPEFKTMLILGSVNSGERINRVNEAYKIIEQGNFENIIVSGGCGAHNSAADNCEAEHMAQLLMQKGISLNKILIEDKSKSTGDNYKYSKKLMVPGYSGLKAINPGDKLLVVSSSENAKAVSYCFRYKDNVDAYHIIVPKSYTPESPNVNYDGGSYSSIVNGCRPSGQSSQPTFQQPAQATQPGYTQSSSGVAVQYPQRQKEIDESWTKISSFVGGIGNNQVWDTNSNSWKPFSVVYPVQTVSSSPATGISAGQTSAGTITPSGTSSEQYDQYILEAEQKTGVEAEFIKAFIGPESGFNPNSITSDAAGLMQVVPNSVHKDIISVFCKQESSKGPQKCNLDQPLSGGEYPYATCTGSVGNCVMDERFDPRKNIINGAEVIKGKIDSVGHCSNNDEGRIKTWALAYNIGQKWVKKARDNVGHCNTYEAIWQDMWNNLDIEKQTIYGVHKNYKGGVEGKVGRKKGEPKDYIWKIYNSYSYYKTNGLSVTSASGEKVSSSGSSFNSPSTAPYQGTYTGGQAQVKDPNCLILYGDTRNPGPKQKIAIESIKRECDDPSLFHVGDFVDQGYLTKHWKEFLDYERDLINQGTLYAIVGNHENRGAYKGKGHQAIADNLGDEFPYIRNQMSNGGHYTAPITSNLIAIILNTETNCNSEIQFLKQQLNANPNMGVMLGFHKPAYPHIAKVHGTGCSVEFHKLLVEHKNRGNKVLAFAGDTHGLARVIRDGVTHLEVGSMVKPRSCISTTPGGEFCKKTRGYYRCDANLHCVAKDENGNTLDEFNVN
jgi:hypothetical protein